jgi:hypothetical protein
MDRRSFLSSLPVVIVNCLFMAACQPAVTSVIPATVVPSTAVPPTSTVPKWGKIRHWCVDE